MTIQVQVILFFFISAKSKNPKNERKFRKIATLVGELGTFGTFCQEHFPAKCQGAKSSASTSELRLQTSESREVRDQVSHDIFYYKIFTVKIVKTTGSLGIKNHRMELFEITDCHCDKVFNIFSKTERIKTNKLLKRFFLFMLSFISSLVYNNLLSKLSAIMISESL